MTLNPDSKISYVYLLNGNVLSILLPGNKFKLTIYFHTIFRLKSSKDFDSYETFSYLREDSFRGVFVISDITAAYYNTMLIRSRKNIIQLSKEKITTVLLAFYLKKHSYLASTIDEYFMRLASNGLLTKWTNDYRDQKFMNCRADKAPQILTLDHVYGIFIICFGLYAISAIVLLLEILSRRINFIRRMFG